MTKNTFIGEMNEQKRIDSHLWSGKYVYIWVYIYDGVFVNESSFVCHDEISSALCLAQMDVGNFAQHYLCLLINIDALCTFIFLLEGF